jgi:hypothetical protein
LVTKATHKDQSPLHRPCVGGRNDCQLWRQPDTNHRSTDPALVDGPIGSYDGAVIAANHAFHRREAGGDGRRANDPCSSQSCVPPARGRRGRRVGNRHVLAAVLGGLLTTFLLAGCGPDKPPFQEVSGRVTFEKQPLRKGLIEFVPARPGGTGAGAIVRDGRYTVRPEAGLLPGEYRVRIVPNVPVRTDWEESSSDHPAGTLQKVQIPAKYNVNTILTAEVKTDGKQTLDFALD